MILTVKEVAERWRLSTNTIYELIQTGQLSCFRAGKAIRIPMTEVARFEAMRSVRMSPEVNKHGVL